MAIANRSSILFLVLAAIMVVQAVAFDRGFGELLSDVWQSVKTPFGTTSLVFLAWGLASVAWSHRPLISLFALGEFVLPVGMTILLALALPGRAPRQSVFIVTAGVLLAAGVIGYEIATGLQWRVAMQQSSNPVIFNRSMLTIVVVAAPILWWLVSIRRFLLAAIVAAGVIGIVMLGESGASALAVLVGFGTWALACLSRRLAIGLCAVAIVASLSLAPIIGDAADDLVPKTIHAQLANAHSRERVDIWQAYGAAVRKAPWIGVGFGMSSRYGETYAAERLGPERQMVLKAFHPHNLAIQVWAELGAIGAILVLTLLLGALSLITRAGGRELPARLAAFMMVVSVSLVAHGAWQGWWAAAVGVSVVWFMVAAWREPSKATMPEGPAFPVPISAREVWSDVGLVCRTDPRTRS